MSFRREFLGATHPFGEHRFGRSGNGFGPHGELLAELREAIKHHFETSSARFASSPGGSSFASELNYQLKSMERGDVAELPGLDAGGGHTQSELEIADAIQRHCNYLGSQLAGIRWAAERLMSERSLRSISKSMENLYRQDFQTGIRLFETKEYSLARASFQKALGSTPTNYFAHQYLGFIAVHEDIPGEAVSRFEAAYRYAETDTHRALALSHLARCRFAAGEMAEAAALARKAADLDGTAAFWYEFAIYSALNGDMKTVLPAIVNAMQNDWVYWAIAVADPLLDRLRGEMAAMMNELRERIARKSRKVLDQLRDLSEGMQNLGGIDTACVQKELAEFERRFSEGNIYQFRDLTAEAEHIVHKVRQTAQEAVSDKIAVRQRALRKNDTWRENQIGQLSSPVHLLRNQRHRLYSTFRAWNAGCATYTAIWCVYMLLVALFVTKASWREIYIVPYVFSFVIPFALPASVNSLNYYFSVRRPQGELDQQIFQLEQKVNPAVQQIERSYEERKSAIEKELNDLEELFERIRKIQAGS